MASSGAAFIDLGYNEVILPSLWSTELFIDKAGPDIVKQLYSFQDKRNRSICLIPEATAIIRDQYKRSWEKSLPKPLKLFYVARCYRYERPQKGRYREFTQFGVERLGPPSPTDKEEILLALRACLDLLKLPFRLVESVKRGLDYYVEDGFEVECDSLGAQKQVAGGGRYDCGIGFALGIDRLQLALSHSDPRS